MSTKLLREAQIRLFMKLASIVNISENFFAEQEEEEEGLEGAPEEAELDIGEPAPEGGEELDVELGAEEGGESDVSEEDVVDIVATIADALETKYGIAVDVEGGADLGPEEAGDELEAELDVEEPAIEEPAAEEGDEELEMMEMFDDEEVVSEVLKRVTARLRKALKEDKKGRKSRIKRK